MNEAKKLLGKDESELGAIPVLLLVGGLGTRLRTVVADRPKPLAIIGENPFLELLVLQLRSQGFRQLVMCTGFQARQVQQELGDGSKWNVSIGYSEEARPLGTGGAIKLAESFLSKSAFFVVMNGDSFLELDLPQMIRFHKDHRGLATIAVRSVPDTSRYGTVHVDSTNKVTGFIEKTGIPEAGLINGGVYIFKHDILWNIPDGPSSLEKDVLPHSLNCGVFAVEQHGMFIDIGTPEDYARAKTMHQKLKEAAVLVGNAQRPKDRIPDKKEG